MAIKDEGLKSFIVFGETWAGVSILTDSQRGRLFQALYAFLGFAPEPELDQATQVVFAMMRPRMEENMAKYFEIREKRSKAGKEGGRPPKATTPEGNQEEANESTGKQTKAKKANAFPEKHPEANGVPESKQNPITIGRSNRNRDRDISSSPEFNQVQGEGVYSQEFSLRHSDAETPQEQKSRARVAPSPRVNLRKDDFAKWYAAYPRHKNPGDAERAWEKGIRDGVIPSDLNVMLDALAWQKQQEQWQDPHYIPYPASYLNKKAWLEEPDKAPARPRPAGLPIYGGTQTYHRLSDNEIAAQKTMQNGLELLAEMEEEERLRNEGGGER